MNITRVRGARPENGTLASDTHRVARQGQETRTLTLAACAAHLDDLYGTRAINRLHQNDHVEGWMELFQEDEAFKSSVS